MNMFARFDENPVMTLQDIKETKRYGRTDGRTDARTDGRTDARTDNMKTVYPTTNKVCGGGGGYNNILYLEPCLVTDNLNKTGANMNINQK